MYTNYSNVQPNYNSYNTEEERFLLVPFVLGGLAGTALGYGIANNQGNNQAMYPVYPIVQSYQPYPMYSYPTYPMYSNSNNYYY